MCGISNQLDGSQDLEINVLKEGGLLHDSCARVIKDINGEKELDMEVEEEDSDENLVVEDDDDDSDDDNVPLSTLNSK